MREKKIRFEKRSFDVPYRNFGVGYLYKGLDAKLIQSVIAAGFMFLSYEQIAALIYLAFGLKRKLKK